MVEACAPSEYEAPPPYSPFFNVPNTSNHRRSIRSMPSTSSASNTNAAEMSSLSSAGWSQNNGMLIFNGGCSTEPKTYVCCKCASQMISDHRYFHLYTLLKTFKFEYLFSDKWVIFFADMFKFMTIQRA